jgi:hypothetical protein
VGEELSGHGLQGIKVANKDLLALVGEGTEEVKDPVKDLSNLTDRADKRGEATKVHGRDDGGGGDPELPREHREAAVHEHLAKVDECIGKNVTPKRRWESVSHGAAEDSGHG